MIPRPWQLGDRRLEFQRVAGPGANASRRHLQIADAGRRKVGVNGAFHGRAVHEVIEKVYADGVFRPVGSVDLPDQTAVEFEPRVVAEPIASSARFVSLAMIFRDVVV